MEKIIAFCGIVCSDCPGYIATQAGDQSALEQLAAKAREDFHQPNITAQSVACDGCLAGDRKCGYCAECDIRACGMARGVVNCAHCTDYACDKLARFFEMVPASRTTLDEIRQAL